MSASLLHLDLLAVAVVVLGAVAWLAARFRSPKPPACHQNAPSDQRTSGADQRTSGADQRTSGADVVLGASLQKGLHKAQARKAHQLLVADEAHRAAH